MQVELLEKGKCFKPIELLITIESADEARAMHAVFNHTEVADLLEKASPDEDDHAEKITNLLSAFGIGPGGEIVPGVAYSDWYK
jgi:hypothetical protein